MTNVTNVTKLFDLPEFDFIVVDDWKHFKGVATLIKETATKVTVKFFYLDAIRNKQDYDLFIKGLDNKDFISEKVFNKASQKAKNDDPLYLGRTVRYCYGVGRATETEYKLMKPEGGMLVLLHKYIAFQEKEFFLRELLQRKFTDEEIQKLYSTFPECNIYPTYKK